MISVKGQRAQDAIRSLKTPLVTRNAAACVILAIFVLVVAFSASASYACRHQFTANRQWLFLAIGLGMLAVLALAAFALRGKLEGAKRALGKNRSFSIAVTLGTVLLLAAQCYVVHEAWFETGWDAGTMSQVHHPEALTHYLSVYPNQVFLYCVFRVVAKIGLILGIQSSYLSLVLGGCLCVSLAVWFSAFSAKAVFGYAVGYATLVVSFFFVGLSPWIMVPYSDAYGILCPSVVLFCYCVLGDTKAKWLPISFFSIIGYFIKPTAIFVLAAILVVELYFAFTRRRGKGNGWGLRSFIITALSLCLGIALAYGVSGAIRHLSPSLDDESAFSMTHFLMMGANTETNGVYYESDVELSQSYSSKAERQSANVQVWRDRLCDLGPAGVAKLAAKKTLCNFADGTFAWAVEGHFWVAEHGSNGRIRSFYGIGNFSSDEADANAMTFQYASQVAWLMLLLGAGLGLTRKNVRKGELVAYLSLVALALFLAVFECRARYLYLYLPYFIMLGVAGWAGIGKGLARWMPKKLARMANREVQGGRSMTACIGTMKTVKAPIGRIESSSVQVVLGPCGRGGSYGKPSALLIV